MGIELKSEAREAMKVLAIQVGCRHSGWRRFLFSGPTVLAMAFAVAGAPASA
jgi:hypothetical protein